MKTAIIVIALFGAIAVALFIGLSSAAHDADVRTEAAAQPASPAVIGWKFEHDDVACVHSSDVAHLAMLFGEGDSQAYQNYADQNECYGIRAGTTVYREDSIYNDADVVAVRRRGDADSLYTMRRNIAPMYAGDPAAPSTAPLPAWMFDNTPKPEQAVVPPAQPCHEYRGPQRDADAAMARAAERANVQGIISRPVDAQTECSDTPITIPAGTRVIVDMSNSGKPGVDQTHVAVEIINPTKDQPTVFVMTDAGAVTLN